MADSQFWVRLEIEDPNMSLLDARSFVDEHVRTVAETVGLLAGAAIDIQVTQIEEDGHSPVVLNSAFDGLDEHDMVDFRTVAMAAVFRPGIQMALTDFRLAIRVGHDTAFLCYRAIDGLRADLAEHEQITNEGKSWERLRSICGVERTVIDGVKAAADPRRHGRVLPLTHEQRQAALSLLRQMTVRYAAWCATEVEELRTALTGTAPTR